MEAGLQKLDQQEQKYAAELDSALAEYATLKEQAAEFYPELFEARQAIRPEKERSARNRVSDMLGEEREEHSVRGVAIKNLVLKTAMVVALQLPKHITSSLLS